MRSAIAGAVVAIIIVAAFSFSAQQTTIDTGRYETKMGEKGIIILDVHTGQYVIAPEVMTAGQVQWIKGKFDDIYKTGLDNKRLPKN
ncbi:hypothetical protein FLA_1564 [Filimonas lacunae]|nr:hypothetical protein FLA_1564 [Filimonas lacunae]